MSQLQFLVAFLIFSSETRKLPNQSLPSRPLSTGQPQVTKRPGRTWGSPRTLRGYSSSELGGYMHIYLSNLIYLSIYLYTHIYIFMCIYVYLYIYIHIYIYVLYIHINNRHIHITIGYHRDPISQLPRRVYFSPCLGLGLEIHQLWQ